ncbi:MAG: dCTP deaminase domain-containing protein, partial [Bacteroidota bacterium]
MILSDQRILAEIALGHIMIEPFDRQHVGTNSYDVHLGRYVAVYTSRILDSRLDHAVEELLFPAEGLVL